MYRFIRIRSRASFLLCASILLVCIPGFALDPHQSIKQYAHTAWNRLGSVGGVSVTAFAQTQDGYLWLGTEGNGLVRFDGQDFVASEPASGQSLPSRFIQSLLAAKNGTLWIGTRGGLASLTQGNLKISLRADSFTSVSTIYESESGSIWIGTIGYTPGGLFRVDHEKITPMLLPVAPGNTGVYDIAQDHTGKLWISDARGLVLYGTTPARIQSDSLSDGVVSIAPALNGTLWLAGIHDLFTYSPDGIKKRSLLPGSPDVGPRRVFVDRDGGVWIGTFGQGLFHLRIGRWERMTQADGLSSDFVYALFEDHEGNIWVGTENGIDRFREYKVSTVRSGNHVFAITEAPAGDICSAIQTTGIYCLQNGETHRLPNSIVSALATDDQGIVMVNPGRGVGRLTSHGFVSISDSFKEAYSIARDRQHNLWFGDIEKGLFRLEPNGKLECVERERFSHKPITFLLPDREGKLWVALSREGIALYEN